MNSNVLARLAGSELERRNLCKTGRMSTTMNAAKICCDSFFLSYFFERLRNVHN